MSIVAIVNPRSGNGKSAAVWARVRRHLPGPVETLETRTPAHAIELAREAIKAGAQTVVAVGGDGTINEVMNGFFERERPIPTQTRLGILPHGTGSDFKRILNLPLDEKKVAAVLHRGDPRLVDVLKVRYTRMDGSSALRYSINITSFGMGGAVAAKVNRSSKPLGGKMAFLMSTLRTALNFSGKSVTLKIDGSEAMEEKITSVAVGNGQYHGAGMWVCPGASISDGILDVTVIRYLSLFALLKGLPVLYNGGIYSHPKVKAYRARRIEATSKESALIEIDGEPLGRLPIEISIVPNAIRVLMP
jgi:YegS/Rv2252/BmrU family lipid kinase